MDGTPIAQRSGYLTAVNRRAELGQMIIQSEYLERALVNRLWAHFLGYGFTQPVDDMGPHNPPTHPELLDYLARQFRACGCDVKQLISWITLSEAYHLSSRSSANNSTDDPLRGEPPKFSRFYLRQIRAEELYQSLLVATQADKTHEDERAQESARQNWLRQFTRAFGTDDGGETTTFDGTIPQTLMMFNGDLIRKATRVDHGTFLGQLASSKLRPTDKIKQLYLAAYARLPTAREMRLAQQLVVARAAEGAVRGERDWRGQGRDDEQPPPASAMPPATAALQDIWWALLNSNEFILNH